MDLTKKLMSVLVLLVCVLIALNNQRAAPHSRSLHRNLVGDESSMGEEEDGGLKYDYYRNSCPSAETIVRTRVRELHAAKNTVGPQLLRLAFHDCFVMGCDASVLLDSVLEMKSEKEEIPNLSLKGFDEIDFIKSRVENECPAVVSCADILALAARESVLLAGGQFYPVLTGRMDRTKAYPTIAAKEIAGPDFNLSQSLHSFAVKGFNAKEMIALLGGGHSTGQIHCNFILKRLFNFNGSSNPDPTIDADFLEVLKSQCSHAASPPSQSPLTEESTPTLAASFENRAMQMDYEGAGNGFGEVYYRSLLLGRALLVSDQQLMTRENTKAMVERYASDIHQFRRDFGLAMFKLTHLIHKTSEESEVRINCGKVNAVV